MPKPKNQHCIRLDKAAVLLIAIVMVIGAVAGTTVAFLTTKTEDVANQFEYGKVSCQVDETFANGTKSKVTIKNTGNIPAYIRAKVVVTWKDADGNVYGKAPASSDYLITYGSEWTQGTDGYYYYNTPVDANGSTPALITECKKTADAAAPEGYDLSVEIIADAIQSQPANARREAWNYPASSGT